MINFLIDLVFSIFIHDIPGCLCFKFRVQFGKLLFLLLSFICKIVQSSYHASFGALQILFTKTLKDRLSSLSLCNHDHLGKLVRLGSFGNSRVLKIDLVHHNLSQLIFVLKIFFGIKFCQYFLCKFISNFVFFGFTSQWARWNSPWNGQFWLLFLFFFI